MRIIYLFLQGILVVSYLRMLRGVVRKSAGLTPILGWLIGLGYFVLAPLTVMTLNGGYELPPIAAVDDSWGTINLMNTTLLVPYLVVWLSMMSACAVIRNARVTGTSKAKSNNSISRTRLEQVILITLGLTVVNWAILVWLVGGTEEFLISHWSHRVAELTASHGDAYVLYDHLTLANQIVFVGASALYTSIGIKNRDTKWGFTSLILLFYLLEMILTGNRMYLAVYLLACFVSCWMFARPKIIVTMLVLSPLLAIVFSAWAFVRSNLMEIPDSVNNYAEEYYGDTKVTLLMDSFDGMGAVLLLNVVHDFGVRFDYLYGITYSRAATSLIPRAIYPNKPQDFTALLADKYLPFADTSVSATAIGEMYANFGPLTLVLFPLLTHGILALNHWALGKKRKRGLLVPVLFVLLVWGVRVPLEDTFIEFLLVIFLIWVLRLQRGLYSCDRGQPALSVSYARSS